MSMIHNIIHTSYNRMHGHGAVRYAMYAVTITKLELLRTNVGTYYLHLEDLCPSAFSLKEASKHGKTQDEDQEEGQKASDYKTKGNKKK